MKTNDKVTDFMSGQDIGRGYGSGDGNGSGYGSGYGSGNGSGYGSGYGSGDGSGRGYGSGDGSGSGNGSGYGSGYGSGNGDGSGYGNGSGLLIINGMTVHDVDGIPTVITHVSGDIATGFVFAKNVYPKRCYVARYCGCYAHGETAREAMEEARRKSLGSMPPESRIRLFLEKFGGKDRIPASELFRWHGILTGSCNFGRKSFCENHGIDIEKDSFTLREFISLTSVEYGSGVIAMLSDALDRIEGGGH